MKFFMVSVGAIGVFATALWLSSDLAGTNTAREPGPAPLATKTDDQGSVSVAVTPNLLLSSVGEWIFSTVLDTHAGDLSEDIAAAATLVDDAGREYAAVKWDGDPPGGHHRQGALIFRDIVPTPQSVDLRLRGVGGVALRRFSWEVQ